MLKNDSIPVVVVVVVEVVVVVAVMEIYFDIIVVVVKVKVVVAVVVVVLVLVDGSSSGSGIHSSIVVVVVVAVVVAILESVYCKPSIGEVCHSAAYPTFLQHFFLFLFLRRLMIIKCNTHIYYSILFIFNTYLSHSEW